MKIGMLWFDNSKGDDLKAKIARAAVYYQKKYGQAPNMCFVHPSMVPPNGNTQKTENEKPAIRSGKVLVQTSANMLPNHFWIGVNSIS